MQCKASGLSRRKFLHTLGISSLLCSISPSIFAVKSPEKDSPKFVDELLFADSNGFGPLLDAPFVEENYIPLHKELNLPSMDAASEEYQNTKSVLKSEFEYTKEAWSDDFRLVWSYQHYGVPDNSTSNTQLIQYCKDVQTYLYNNIRGLENLNIAWQSLDNNMDVVSKTGNHALVGKFTYFVLRVSAIDKKGTLQETYLIKANPVNRAFHYFGASDGDVQNPDQRLIYVIGGATSLVSPFSEMIHLSTHKPAMRYANELSKSLEHEEAQALARSSGETVTESAAVIMAMDYLYKTGNADRAQQIVHHAKSLNRQLRGFSQSISYMQKYGVQRALDLYKENPGDYMNAIARMG